MFRAVETNSLRPPWSSNNTPGSRVAERPPLGAGHYTARDYPVTFPSASAVPRVKEVLRLLGGCTSAKTAKAHRWLVPGGLRAQAAAAAATCRSRPVPSLRCRTRAAAIGTALVRRNVVCFLCEKQTIHKCPPRHPWKDPPGVQEVPLRAAAPTRKLPASGIPIHVRASARQAPPETGSRC